MRIRLIQPPLVQPRYRQLTLPVVGAELSARGLEVEACDENVEPLDESPVELVGITCHVYNAPRAFELARRFRARGAKVVLGGTFPTVAPDLAAPHCDSVVVGELEGVSARLADDARAGRLAPLYRAEQPAELSRTVRPDLGLIDSSRYLRMNFPVELSRGCRFACRFCTNRALWGAARTRSLADVERDLSQHDHGLIEVVDVNFLNDPGFFRAALPLLRAAPGPGWTGQTTVLDLAADPGLPERLAQSRCRSIFVGLETTSPEGLRSVDKAWLEPARFLEVARRLREAGVLVQVGVIVGLDSDEPDGFARLADFLDEARVHTLTASYLHYYPGTRPYEALRREGRLLSEDWRDLDGNHLTIRPLKMDPGALQEEVARLLRRFYGARSVGLRAGHSGFAREPAQLVHHVFQNAVMRAYYRDLERERAAGDGAGGQRYGAAPEERWGGRLERAAADAAAWALDRLLGPR